jgi:TolB-like protein/Flp pilus assembly protein TadD
MATVRAERRLTAIMVADIVGYSHLVEADEAATLAAIKNLQREVIEPLLAEHHGRLVKLMGDGALVEFGSVVDAVACAAAIQSGVAEHADIVPPERRITYRIGVNLGDVVVEGDDLLGDGVNFAARLEQLCEPGGVLISGTVYDHLQGKLDLTLEDAGEQQVKNISRPVRTYRVRLDGTMPRRRRTLRAMPRLGLAAAIGLSAMILALSVWQFWPAERQLSERAGIAVLPFDNLSGDESTGRIADGLTEDIITDLSHFRDLDVIARNSTVAYKSKPVDVREVGRAFNVGYVLEGSLQRQDDRVRITAQLIDAVTDAHVWSNRWDRPTADLFAVQSEVAEQVAAKLGGVFGLGQITAAEVQRAKRRPPADLTAYEHYLLAVEAKGLRSPETGMEHAEKAIALDPNFARAYTVRGWLRYFSTDTISDPEEWRRAFELAGDDFRRGVALDPADAEARIGLGVYLLESGQLAESEAEFRRALDQSPANAHVLGVAANVLPNFGKPEEAVTLADRALRLDPHMPPATLGALKDAYFFTRRFDRAIEIVNAVPESSRSPWARLLLAASYAMLGRTDEAAAAKANFIAKPGEPSAEQWLNQGLVFARPAEQGLFVEAFRRIGLPVCATAEQAAKLAKRLPECTKT